AEVQFGRKSLAGEGNHYNDGSFEPSGLLRARKHSPTRQSPREAGSGTAMIVKSGRAEAMPKVRESNTALTVLSVANIRKLIVLPARTSAEKDGVNPRV